MSDLGNKEVFAKNLKYYMDLNNKTRNDIAKITNVPYSTVSSWCNALFYPRIDKIEMLANYFNILKSDLVEDKENKGESQHTYYMCPVYGQISAGQPNWAVECIEGRIPIDPELMGIVNPEEHYFLRVNGESMNKVVKNGSFALIHKQDYVENGEIAVVLVNGDDATLKHFSQEGDIVVLTPDSTDENFKQQIYTKDTPIKVIGKYIGKMENKWIKISILLILFYRRIKMAKRGNGEGTIYFSEKLNKWVGQYTNGRKENGSINRMSVYGSTRKEVKDKLQKKLEEVSKGIINEKCDYTVYQLGYEILETKYATNKIKGTSYNSINYPLTKIQKSNLGNMKIQKVTYKHIQSFLNTTTSLSNSYIEKIMIQLNTIFNEAINRDYIYKNPMRNVIRPISNKQDKKVDAFSIEEQKLLLEAFKKSKYNDLFSIAIFSGMRIGEILALQPNDIDLNKNIIHITKTISKDKNSVPIIGNTPKTSTSYRDIPITSLYRNNIINALNTMIDNPNNLIFCTNTLSIFVPNNANCFFQRICKGIIDRNVNTHMLRHTYATRCIESGMPAEVLQKLLGHKNITTTINTYTTIFDKYRDDEVQKSVEKIALKLKN